MHLSDHFAAPHSSYVDATNEMGELDLKAEDIDGVSQFFPACMHHLHNTLRQNAHLKHYGRLQYTLFLKGIGLSLSECLSFWRQAFKRISEDTFNKEYRYNVRHAYGDAGGDANRRGQGYSAFSCQKILTEHPPSVGESHGCPYRHFSPDNLSSFLRNYGAADDNLLRNVQIDVNNRRYHIACNQVFDWKHKQAIVDAKNKGSWTDEDSTIIVHPNTYFKRSFLLGRTAMTTQEQAAS